ncbi:hypothetical protein ACFX12_047181 [Malus domestica]
MTDSMRGGNCGNLGFEIPSKKVEFCQPQVVFRFFLLQSKALKHPTFKIRRPKRGNCSSKLGIGSRNTYNNDSTNKKRRNLQARTRKIGPKED